MVRRSLPQSFLKSLSHPICACGCTCAFWKQHPYKAVGLPRVRARGSPWIRMLVMPVRLWSSMKCQGTNSKSERTVFSYRLVDLLSSCVFHSVHGFPMLIPCCKPVFHFGRCCWLLPRKTPSSALKPCAQKAWRLNPHQQKANGLALVVFPIPSTAAHRSCSTWRTDQFWWLPLLHGHLHCHLHGRSAGTSTGHCTGHSLQETSY